MNTQLLKDLKGILYESGSFTVYVRNSMLGSAKYVGTFDSKEEAEDYAKKEASRSRKFASFQVWTGTPKKPGKEVDDAIDGHAGSKIEEKRSCVSCGAKVPEKDSPPYAAHKKSCALVKKWMSGTGKGKAKTEELEESGSETAIMQHLALAAQASGVDLTDHAALKTFVTQVKTIVTKDVAKLSSTLRRFTAGKARETIRAAKAAV